MATKVWTIELDEGDMDALQEAADEKFSEVRVELSDDHSEEDVPDEEEQALSDQWERITEALTNAKSTDPEYAQDEP